MKEKFWKIRSVPLTKIYRSSYLTLNYVPYRRPEIAFFVTFSQAYIAFFALQRSVLEKGMAEKFVDPESPAKSRSSSRNFVPGEGCERKILKKKIQKFLSVRSIGPLSFKNFHWNDHRWGNETTVARITNFSGGKLTPTNWFWKSANIGWFREPSAIRIHGPFFLARNFFFCSTV